MNLDATLMRYFGTRDLAALRPESIPAATERMLVDLGMAKDAGERFALWSLLDILGAAPDLDVTFKSEEDREAARNFMDLMARMRDGEQE